MKKNLVFVLAVSTALSTLSSADPSPFIFAGDQSLGDFDIVRMNVDGSNLVRLTNWSGDEYGVDVSPNGEYMAFNSNASGTHQIYVMNLSNGSVQQITHAGENMFPRWNPDGSKLLISTGAGAGAQHDLAIMNADGTGLSYLLNSALYETQAEWSPNGSKIVFSMGTPNGGQNIWTMNADGTGQTQITDMAWDEYMPTWSPDGSQVTFHALVNDWDVMRVDANGANLTNLTNHGGPDQGPSWTPEGQVLFTSHRQADSIFRMNADGSDVTLVREGYFTAPRVEFAVQTVPEPTTLAALGFASLWCVRIAKRRNAAR